MIKSLSCVYKSVYTRCFSTCNECSNKSSLLSSFLQLKAKTEDIETIRPFIKNETVRNDKYDKYSVYQKAILQIDEKIEFHKAAGLKIKEESYESMKKWMKWFDLRQTIFISIDVEVYEHKHDVPLEVGISIMDFKNQQYSPFPNFLNLHFIINSKHKNGNYVPDNMQRFLNGFSYKVNKKDFKNILIYILQKYDYFDKVTEIPKVALVGHSFKSDIAFFKKAFGLELNNEVPIIDINDLWKMTFEEKIMRKSRLSYMLRKLNIPAVYLHNGANDAYFTLIAAMKLLDPELRISLYCRSYEMIYDRENTELMSVLKPEVPESSQLSDKNAHLELMDKCYKFNIYDNDLEYSLANSKKFKPAPNNYFFGVRSLTVTKIKSLLNDYWNKLNGHVSRGP